MKWTYGVTTVPKRFEDLWPKTMDSLARAGFDKPRLFIDNCVDPLPWLERYPGLHATTRWPAIRTYANWVLALAELFFRDPHADRYAIFQDDLIAVRNLRAYLESWYPRAGYQNLFTFASNEGIAPPNGGWFEARRLSEKDGSAERWQTGRGAVALVFDNEAVSELLTGQRAVKHVIDHARDRVTGIKKVDGSVVTALNKAGWREWVHSPSLVQHTGRVSSMRNKPHAPSKTFPGESFDALKFFEMNR